MRRPLPVLVASNAVSSYGTYLNLVALNLYALETTGSALSVGFFLLLRVGSSFLAGFVSGRLVVRFDRTHLMIGGDLCQALTLLGFVLAPDSARAVLLYALAVVMGGCSTLTGVARRSSVPDLVGQEQRVRANGMLVTGRSVAMILGFASAGLVVAVGGYTAAFLVDAATFLLSAGILTSLVRHRAASRTKPASAAATAGSGADGPTDTAGGRDRMPKAVVWRYAPVLLALIAVRAVDNLGSASHQVGLPVYAAQIDPEGAAAFVGRFFAVWAVGALLAHQLISRVPWGRRWAGGSGTEEQPGGERAFAVGTCLMSGFFILAFADLPILVLLPVVVAAGVADGFTEIVYNSRLQALPEVRRGRLFGYAAMAETGALGLGTVLWAALLEHHTPFSVVAVAHGTAIGMSLLFLLLLTRLPAFAAERADGHRTCDARTDETAASGRVAAD